MYKDNKLYHRSKRFEWSVVSLHITWLKVPYIGLSDELHHSTKETFHIMFTKHVLS